MLELLLAEQEKLSLLLVTHDERVARRCRRIVYMTDGRIESESSPPALPG